MREVRCPVCNTGLRISPARSRKARKPKLFLMLACPEDGRHFRGFINDPEFVGRVTKKVAEIVTVNEETSTGTGTAGG